MIIGKSTKPVYIRFVSNLSLCKGYLRVTPSSALITLGLWFLRSKFSKNHCHPHHNNRRRHQNHFENTGIAFVGTDRIRTTGRHLSQYCTGFGFEITHPLVFLLHILSLWSSSCFGKQILSKLLLIRHSSLSSGLLIPQTSPSASSIQLL